MNILGLLRARLWPNTKSAEVDAMSANQSSRPARRQTAAPVLTGLSRESPEPVKATATACGPGDSTGRGRLISMKGA
jgi:hypothetical protein